MAKSDYKPRAFRSRGKLTTIKLEPQWWRLLAELCKIQGRRSCDVLSEIEKKRGRQGNRAAAVRLYICDGFAEAVRLHAATRVTENPLSQ
jgi:predicted DNA-binding ribbon-helix-helix protein